MKASKKQIKKVAEKAAIKTLEVINRASSCETVGEFTSEVRKMINEGEIHPFIIFSFALEAAKSYCSTSAVIWVCQTALKNSSLGVDDKLIFNVTLRSMKKAATIQGREDVLTMLAL